MKKKKKKLKKKCYLSILYYPYHTIFPTLIFLLTLTYLISSVAFCKVPVENENENVFILIIDPRFLQILHEFKNT